MRRSAVLGQLGLAGYGGLMVFVSLAIALTHPMSTSWLAPSMPFFVLAILLMMSLRAWLNSGSDARKARARETLQACDAKEVVDLLADRYKHADNLFHQRIAFWLVAEAALLAAVSEAINVPEVVIILSVSGIALTVLSTLSCWVIHERTNFALHELMDRQPAQRAFIEVVPKTFPSGAGLLNHAIPVVWLFAWIAILVGQLVGVW